MEIASTACNGPTAAVLLGAGGPDMRSHALPDMPDPANVSSQAYWLAPNERYGVTAPLSTPAYYASGYISDQLVQSAARLYDPLFGPLGSPYYPQAFDALLEVLYGRTRDQIRADIFNEAVIHIPYDGPFIESFSHVPGAGLLARVGGRLGRGGYRLEVVWKTHVSDSRLAREVLQLAATGEHLTRADAEPVYASVALLDGAGMLVDHAELESVRQDTRITVAVPPTAVTDAFDFLDSAWRNAFKTRLLTTPRMSEVAGVLSNVGNQEQFEARLSDLMDVLKTMKVPDEVLGGTPVTGIARDASLARLKLLLEARLGSDDYADAVVALDYLRALNDLRRAYQHSGTAIDIPTSFANIGVAWPPVWPEAWELVRIRVVECLTAIRRAVERVGDQAGVQP